MSHEIYWVYTGSSTLYAQVRQGKQANQIWNTSGTPAFETYATANIANYDIALTEQGTGSNFYSGNFPTGITTPGLYLITIHEQAGGGPAESDTILSLGELHWNGSEARPVADTMWMNTGALDTPEAEISLKSLVVYNDSGAAVGFTSLSGVGLGISGSGGAVSITSDTSEPTLLVQNYTGPAVLLESDFANAVNVVGDVAGISITGEGGPGLSVTSSHTSGYVVEITSSSCGGLLLTGNEDEPVIKIEHGSSGAALPGAIDIVGEVFFRSEPYAYVEGTPTPADDGFDANNGNLSSTDDFYNGMFLVFQSGTLAGQARQISDYVGATQSFSFAGSGTDLDRPFTSAPGTDDRFIIVGLAKG